MPAQLRDFREVLDDLLESMTYADRVASTREVGALALAVNQVTTIGDDDEQVQVSSAFGERLIELSFLTTEVLKAAQGSDRTRRMEELRSRIIDSGLIAALDGFPLASRGGAATTSSLDLARDRAAIAMAELLDERVEVLNHTLRDAWKSEEILQATTQRVLDQFQVRSQTALAEQQAEYQNLATGTAELAFQARKILEIGQIHQSAAEHVRREAEEKTYANRWVLASLGLGVIGIVVIALGVLVQPHVQAATLTQRLTLVAVIGGVATFCGRQAAEHRRRQRHLSDRAIEMNMALGVKSLLGQQTDQDTLILRQFPAPKPPSDPRDLTGPAISPIRLGGPVTEILRMKREPQGSDSDEDGLAPGVQK